ncbi:MAG TPA: Smr/MutS family protein [Steroidobacteraceae bacterium]|nr:Smr/MutS family protein [Steroidobacteraceae bacterium]
MGKKRIPDPGAEPADSSDAAAFRTAMRDVTPLIHRPSRAMPATAKRARARKPVPDVAENLDELMPLIATAADDESASASLSFRRGGVRDQVLRRLRRGLYPTEDELDLHGLNQTAARDQLAEFIARSRNAGRRCVRIVHGKGYRSGARGPILKAAVNLWLRRHSEVVAFTSARMIDGGTGAVYVLLRA